MSERRFPIQRGPSIRWSVIAPHEYQAQRNHGQTLERLAERGGLCPIEALAVLEDRSYPISITEQEIADHRLRFAEWVARTDREINAEIVAIQEKLTKAEKERDAAISEAGQPDWQCMYCGCLGPFAVVINGSPNDGYDYDMVCPECECTEIAESPSEAFRAQRERADEVEATLEKEKKDHCEIREAAFRFVDDVRAALYDNLGHGRSQDQYIADIRQTIASNKTLSAMLDSTEANVVELLAILKEFIDKEPCSLDHHGYCQAHGHSNPCCVQTARDLIKKLKKE